jgi:hypothetical protein
LLGTVAGSANVVAVAVDVNAAVAVAVNVVVVHAAAACFSCRGVTLPFVGLQQDVGIIKDWDPSFSSTSGRFTCCSKSGRPDWANFRRLAY